MVRHKEMHSSVQFKYLKRIFIYSYKVQSNTASVSSSTQAENLQRKIQTMIPLQKMKAYFT
jgi:hypothetical protein